MVSAWVLVTRSEGTVFQRRKSIVDGRYPQNVTDRCIWWDRRTNHSRNTIAGPNFRHTHWRRLSRGRGRFRRLTGTGRFARGLLCEPNAVISSRETGDRNAILSGLIIRAATRADSLCEWADIIYYLSTRYTRTPDGPKAIIRNA